MYSMIHSNRLTLILGKELPAAIAALVIAELLYKFHSFTFECLAFLATWYVFGWGWERMVQAWQNNRQRS